MRPRPSSALILLALLPACAAAMRPCFAGCGEQPPVLEEPPAPPPTLTDVVRRCRGLNGSDDPCTTTVRFEPAHCSQAVPCDTLVVLFADSEEHCGRYGRLLRDFAEAGHIAACVSLFETSGRALEVPFVELADRVDRALEGLSSSGAVEGRWTGRFLSLVGAGRSATAALVAMARTDLDDAAHWRGDEATAACFADPFTDIVAVDALLGEGASGRPCEYPNSHRALLSRYYEDPPEAHACDNGRCPCGEAHTSAIDIDGVVDVDPSAFAIKRWALIECGSALDACSGDVAPGPPIERVCTALEAADGYTCSFTSLPRTSHDNCLSRAVAHCVEFGAPGE